MARCNLHLDHPKCQTIGNASQSDLEQGLDKLRDKVAQDHKITGFFVQPMPKYPAYQNKIWQWDFAPEGDSSGTRKGWRVYAYIPNYREPEPITATAFLVFDKQFAPKGDYVKYLAGVLKKFLAETVVIEAEEDQFRDQVDQEGMIISHCHNCWDMVVRSSDREEVEVAKGVHKQECVGHPPD